MTQNINDKIAKAREALADADAILIGASNGLSIAEGYNIFADNEMFRTQFGDFREKYGIRSVLDGVFARNMSRDDYREYLTRLVKLWYHDYDPSPVMMNLRSIVGDKPYFILTTNADEHLEKSGFDPENVWEIEGTFRDSLSGNQPKDKMAQLNSFLNRYKDNKTVILELGIGSRNRLIKLPLMRLTQQSPGITYITLNLPHEIYVPEEIEFQSIAVPGDLASTLKAIDDGD